MQLSWARVASTVLLLVSSVRLLGGGATWLVIQTIGKTPAAKPAAGEHREARPRAQTKPAVQHRLGYHRSGKAQVPRVEDATSHEPIGLARVRVENLNLADELGVDSEAMTGCPMVVRPSIIDSSRTKKWTARKPSCA